MTVRPDSVSTALWITSVWRCSQLTPAPSVAHTARAVWVLASAEAIQPSSQVQEALEAFVERLAHHPVAVPITTIPVLKIGSLARPAIILCKRAGAQRECSTTNQ